MAHMNSRLKTALRLCLLCLLALAAPPGRCQVSVLTQHNDNLRTGANLSETTLTTANVNAGTFGKLFTLPVDGFTLAQPLYVPGVAIAGGTHNVVYVATAHDSVYAFDADTGAKLVPQVSLGIPVPSSVINTPNTQVEIGIISTPVIDPVAKTLYVVAKTYDGNVQRFWLHALDLATLQDKMPKVLISAQSPGVGMGGDTIVNGQVQFQATQENQRPSLTLVNGVLYIAFASYEDYDPYHGWVLAYNASTLNQTAVCNVTPNGGRGGIWMSGQGLAADSSGSVYLISGNSSQSSENSTGDLGESFIKLTLSGSSLTASDYFKPNNYDSLNSSDADLGAGGAVGIPGTTLLIGGGKQGVLYLVNTANMGGLNLGGDRVVQEWQADNGLWGAPVFWSSATPTLYVWGNGDKLKAYAFNGSTFSTTPGSVSSVSTPGGGDPCGALSVSSNGNVGGTGIVWATIPLADPDHNTVNGTLYAFDATNVGRELWDSRQNAARDDFGKFAKFVAPTVANGKVYVGTDAGQVCVYGLLPVTKGGTGTVLGVNFVGGGSTPLAAGETAGVVPTTNWNNATGAAGSLSGLQDNTGATTGAAASWQCPGVWSLPITESAGNVRLMKGYLDTPNGAGDTVTITVSGLPASITANGYDVYVYTDGDNNTATRTGNYTIGGTTISATDNAGANFGGTFVRASNGPGNYIVFPSVGGSGFTLKATAGAASDGTPRAPVNAVQVVGHTATSNSVTIKSVSTGAAYTTGVAQVGASPYIDRTYTVSSLSTGLAGGVLISTANSDKAVKVASHLTFAVSAPATVYTCYDVRGTTLPAWLNDGTWTLSSQAISTTDTGGAPMKVYAKSVPAGTVTLGGNMQAPASGAGSNYFVIVRFN